MTTHDTSLAVALPPLTSLGVADVLDTEDLERRARSTLAEGVYLEVAGGSSAMISLHANRQAFRDVRVIPRPLRAAVAPVLDVSLLGSSVSAPLYVAPMAQHRRMCEAGELATARAAAAAGVLFMVATRSSYSLEEIASVATGPRWFQLYCMRDRGITIDLMSRAKAADYGALVLTIDAPVSGVRWRITGAGSDSVVGSPNVARYISADELPHISYRGMIDHSMTWDDVAWIVERCELPVVVKGVLDPGDAQIALEVGARGVIVSNHGGRMLDRVPATLDMLPAIADRIGGEIPILIDGGVRDGVDVMVALARGASAAGVGRPVMWALATGGEPQVSGYLRAVVDDLERSLRLAGVGSATEVGDLVTFSNVSIPPRRDAAARNVEPFGSVAER